MNQKTDSAYHSEYQVYLLRLRRDQQDARWTISLQPAQESKQHVFVDVESLLLYLHKQMDMNPM